MVMSSAFSGWHEKRGAYKDLLQEQLYGDKHGSVTTNLIESGLSEHDAREVGWTAAGEMAECVLSAIEREMIRRGEDPKEVYAASEPPASFGSYTVDEQASDSALSICILSALSKAGLVSR